MQSSIGFRDDDAELALRFVRGTEGYSVGSGSDSAITPELYLELAVMPA